MSVLLSHHKEELKKFDRNVRWFQENYKELKKKYPGEYVAVYNEQVIMHDTDVKAIIDELKKRFEDIGTIVIEYISDEKYELIL